MIFPAQILCIFLISIGTWFIFTPEVVPERTQYDLAILESISPEFGGHGRKTSELIFRKAEYVPESPAQREMVYIEKITGNDPGEITIPATLAYIEPVLYTKPPNTLGYALTEPGEKTLVGKIFSGLFGKIKAPFEEKSTPSESESSDGFLWNLAELGMKGVNAMGDHDYTVVRDYNDKGNVKGLIILEE